MSTWQAKKIVWWMIGIYSILSFCAAQNALETQQWVTALWYIPQTTISSPFAASQCLNDIGDANRVINQLAFYQWQQRYLYSTLAANNIGTYLRIFNDYDAWNTTTSSRVYVYNPFGALSKTPAQQAPNTFVSDFWYKSHIKPANVDRVYVGYQYDPMYFVGTWYTRTGIAGQIVHNIRRMEYLIYDGVCSPNYTCFPTINNYRWLRYQVGGWGIPGSGNYRFKIQNGWTRSDQWEYLCNNIYIARCGDGIIDDPEKVWWNNVDGKQGIATNNGFANRVYTWFEAELCDDGNNLNGDWCNATCSGTGDGWFCGDSIVNDGLTDAWHGPTYTSGWVEQFEECDFWDTLNGSDMCTSQCLFPVMDAAVDEAIDE